MIFGPPARQRAEVKEKEVIIRKGGEGDRESARRYNESATEFVESEEGQEAIERSGTDDRSTDCEASEAEAVARRRAKELDPRVRRDYKEATRDDD